METNLKQNELVHLARLCVQEQGGSEAGVKGEASLMANLARKHGREVYDYVRNSGWFSRASYWMENGNATEEQVDWVESWSWSTATPRSRRTWMSMTVFRTSDRSAPETYGTGRHISRT